MTIEKTPCAHQGPGKENPADTGGYDIIRSTGDPLEESYWISSEETAVYDAGLNNGAGGTAYFQDLLRISKGATGGCDAQVTLDIEVNPLSFTYFPPHSLDVVFVLDVTSSMMSGGSRKMALAKRALIRTINMLWEQNRDTVVTVLPFARDAYVALPAGGLSYDYLGTLFTWRRSTTSGNLIGQILGYRNGSYVSATDIPAYMDASAPIAASTELSLYNYYNYYKIRYSDIYNDDGTAKPDMALKGYLDTIYAADPAAYTGNFIEAVAAGTPLSSAQLPYSMNDGGYENNTILDNMIWAVPYGEDTNTEAGLKAAYTLLKTPGFTQSDDILRRAVILLTDGQANRSINPEYAGVYATPASVDSDFAPNAPGEPWKYFLYLQQTLPALITEISDRSATSQELVLALERAYETAGKIKDPEDGNASVFVLGIEIGAQEPGPYTKDDVLNIMRTIASTGSYLHQAAEKSSENPIIEELERLARYLLVLTGSLRVSITDAINTALFEYVPGSIRITGEQDGIRLKSLSAPDITDPDDPDYTVYHKPALLPDVSDDNVENGSVSVYLGEAPFPIASPDSRTNIRIQFRITGKGAAHGEHLHTNIDMRSFTAFLEPNHLNAATPELTYNNPPRELFFQTPVVACDTGFTIEKYIGVDPDGVDYKTQTVQGCKDVYYRVIVRNYTDEAAYFPLLYDVQGVRSISEALVSSNRMILAVDFTVPAGGYREFIYIHKAACADGTVENYAVLETGDGYIYDNASAEVINAPVSYTVEYLNYCSGQKIAPDKEVTDAYACDQVNARDHAECIPCWLFACAKPWRLDLCEGERVLRLYYAPCGSRHHTCRCRCHS